MWYIYAIEYYSATKRNEFESVVLKWRNLEPIMQNEAVRKRKANIVYQCIYMESKKSSTDEPICREGMEMQMDLWAQRDKERLGWIEKVALTYVHNHV